MTFMLPHYLTHQNRPSPVLNYIWDDTRADEDFHYDSADLVIEMTDMATRSRIALCIGIYEWIIWRFHCLTDDPAPFQIAEAAWCGNINADYVEYIEFNRKDYLGPVRGPLYGAMASLVEVINYTSENKDAWVEGLMFLAPLAMHVLPDTNPFEEWLEYVTDRLLRLYPEPEDNPYEDIFNDHEEERRGPLVAREALDPSFDYHPDQAPELLDNFLRSVDHMANPFLRSPEELMELGIEHPYRVLP